MESEKLNELNRQINEIKKRILLAGKNKVENLLEYGKILRICIFFRGPEDCQCSGMAKTKSHQHRYDWNSEEGYQGIDSEGESPTESTTATCGHQGTQCWAPQETSRNTHHNCWQSHVPHWSKERRGCAIPHRPQDYRESKAVGSGASSLQDETAALNEAGGEIPWAGGQQGGAEPEPGREATRDPWGGCKSKGEIDRIVPCKRL